MNLHVQLNVLGSSMCMGSMDMKTDEMMSQNATVALGMS